MPVNQMAVGRDYSIVFYDSNTGSTVDLGDVQSFTITAQKHDIKSMPYNGDPRFGYIDDGYKISFTITRVNPDLEDFQLDRAEQFRRGEHVRDGYLNEIIRNPDGTVSRYQYSGFVFYLTDIGEVSREKTIAMKAEGMASTKVRIA
jgi:hypothetical protein